MYAVEINPGGKQIRSPREGKGGQITAVRSAPNTNSLRVHVLPRLQVQTSSDYVVELACAPRSVVDRFPKVQPIADAATVIHRKHHVSVIREELVQSVGIRIIVHVMEAQQHLPARPAMKEHQCGMLRNTVVIARQKELA